MPGMLRRDGLLLREAGERRDAEGNDEERKPAGHVRFVSRKETPTSSGGGNRQRDYIVRLLAAAGGIGAAQFETARPRMQCSPVRVFTRTVRNRCVPVEADSESCHSLLARYFSKQ